jgi:hypothetical protein
MFYPLLGGLLRKATNQWYVICVDVGGADAGRHDGQGVKGLMGRSLTRLLLTILFLALLLGTPPHDLLGLP